MVVQIKNLHFAYAGRQALRGVSFDAAPGNILGLLGPNGSGKTTLFRILSTLMLPADGTVTICGFDVAREVVKVREKIGIVFQSPSLDPKLNVQENIQHQGHLYGLYGSELQKRSEELMKRLGVLDRKKEIVSKLSGGLKRRVELAKGLLHRPTVLILDEPSTGLDPGARIDLWNYLKQLRDQENITILVTTHLMEEAEHCNALVIMNHGQVVGSGTPESLKSEISGGVVILKAAHNSEIASSQKTLLAITNPSVIASPAAVILSEAKNLGINSAKQSQSDALEALHESIQKKFQVKGLILEGELQIEHAEGPKLMAKILETFPGQIESVTFRRPTLEDVFIHKTGHRFWNEKL
ncbi:MAG: ABC transporter ATP-binding protein [Candidatus Omnitrophica bacterium]|nr:ABC transporter ATP-binding protein [Candidatus Omnitrophota bacterium]